VGVFFWVKMRRQGELLGAPAVFYSAFAAREPQTHWEGQGLFGPIRFGRKNGGKDGGHCNAKH
jgi:hypothetical protein